MSKIGGVDFFLPLLINVDTHSRVILKPLSYLNFNFSNSTTHSRRFVNDYFYGQSVSCTLVNN